MKIERLIHELLQRGPYKTAAEVTERENYQTLRAELDHADEQLARGDYTEYDENTLHELAEDIKTRGMARLRKAPQATTEIATASAYIRILRKHRKTLYNSIQKTFLQLSSAM